MEQDLSFWLLFHVLFPDALSPYETHMSDSLNFKKLESQPRRKS